MRTRNPAAAALLAGVALCSIAAAQQRDPAAKSIRIEWAEFKKLYDTGKVVVVDVRSAEAFEAGHVPGARSIPLDQIEKRAGELKALEKPIVLYCA